MHSHKAAAAHLQVESDHQLPAVPVGALSSGCWWGAALGGAWGGGCGRKPPAGADDPPPEGVCREVSPTACVSKSYKSGLFWYEVKDERDLEPGWQDLLSHVLHAPAFPVCHLCLGLLILGTEDVSLPQKTGHNMPRRGSFTGPESCDAVGHILTATTCSAAAAASIWGIQRSCV